MIELIRAAKEAIEILRQIRHDLSACRDVLEQWKRAEVKRRPWDSV